MKTVALFGGSFNPPHDGHLSMCAHIHAELKPDEVWMMFSINRLKDQNKYESLEHRMAMTQILAQHHPDVPLKLTDIEQQIGTNETFFVLSALQERYPDHRFIWVMGADNLIGFEKWVNADKIFENFSIAIVDRPGYSDKARASATLQKFASQERSTAADFTTDDRPGWIFMSNPMINMSSSDFLKRLRAGETEFEGHMNDVATYIRRHGLYGTVPPSPATAAPRLAPKP